ncbi:MAG TPA: metallophosphoesterase family protein [Vicinamibacterales bacterium]|nr:metallophosphoesterase family protein [Vicinamibacterales bacterium]
MVIGLISDTHGLLRPEALAALRDAAVIVHAGDVGAARILAELRKLAPVHAVYGNVDDPADPQLSKTLSLEVEGLRIHVSHGHEFGSPTPARLLATYDADVIVYGHTHRPLVHRLGSRLVVNPGAAGPRRFDIQPSVALMTTAGGEVDVRIVQL